MKFQDVINYVSTKVDCKISMDRQEMIDVTKSWMAAMAQGCYVGPDQTNKPETIFVIFTNNDLFSIKVLFHELTHWTGKNTLLNRDKKNHALYLSCYVYDREEIIAESTALELLKHYNLLNEEIEQDCQRYLNTYKIPEQFASQLFFTQESINQEVEKAKNYLINLLGNLQENVKVA